MRKSLFAIGLLAAGYSVQAQNVLLHVDDAAITYVGKGTLVYSGGGLQMKGNGTVENHGNFMVEGSGTDSFKTVDASGVDKTEANGGGNFVNKLNEPTAYASFNSNSPTATPVYTYGQLFINNIPQANITGVVDQEFRAVNHGDYQQIGMPFYDKTASTISTELGKTFTNARWTKNEILTWDNTNVVSQNVNTSTKFGTTNPAAYYSIGGLGLDVSNTTRTLKGRPLADAIVSAPLQNAGNSVNFGTNGNNLNSYQEKYVSYVQDGFHTGSGTAWQGSYGKNLYQFSNPYLTNLDLSNIARNEASGDGVNLTNIQGVRLEVSGVLSNNTPGGGGGTGSTTYKFITFPAGVPTGDVDYTVVRPLGTFAVKLLDNSTANTINFANLRRFNYYGRAETTAYNVAANKMASANGTVKQLGVIALDANGKELGRTYYVVYPNGTTGNSTNAKTQVTAATNNQLSTFEEIPTGGADTTNQRWLYINEANENNFKGKNIRVTSWNNNIKSYKFEIRENAKLVANGTHPLSTGIGFYYKAPDGAVMPAAQNAVVPVTGAGNNYDLYYGEPEKVLVAQKPVATPSKTVVVYNPEITNYVVRFDPNWKKADIEVYDMSGKLVLSKKAVDTSRDFVIELDGSIKNSYVVKVVSDTGETVNTKILK